MAGKPTHSKDARDEARKSSRDEISTDAVHPRTLPRAFDADDLEKNTAGISPQEMQFVRRVTELLPILSQEQVEALRERIDSGYYANPEVTRLIAQRLSEIFGTD